MSPSPSWIESWQRWLCIVVGHGDYAAYQRTWRRHAHTPMLDEAAFLRARQEARYGSGKIKRCPC